MTLVTDTEEQPEPRRITANQLVAYNMAHYRGALGMTQEELAGKLMQYTGEPWSKATVSAAERSFYEGGRVRQFDASDLIALSMALGVPIAGFLLPPDEDTDGQRFTIAATASGGISTGRLMEILFRDPSQERERAMPRYLERYHQARDRYFGKASAPQPAYLVQQQLEESLAKVQDGADELPKLRHWLEQLLYTAEEQQR